MSTDGGVEVAHPNIDIDVLVSVVIDACFDMVVNLHVEVKEEYCVFVDVQRCVYVCTCISMCIRICMYRNIWSYKNSNERLILRSRHFTFIHIPLLLNIELIAETSIGR